MRARGVCTLTVLFFALGVLSDNRLAADWPQWRGPNQDGTIADFVPPATWPKDLESLWQIEVGAGHSSPIVVDGRVYVMTRLDDKNEVVQCFDLEKGERIWRDEYESNPQLSPAVGKFVRSPRATPAFGAGRVYTLGAGGVLSAYDAVKGGLLWRQAFEDFKPSFAEFGSAASPMAIKDTVIAMVGGKDKGMLAALNGKTGKIEWKLDNEGPGYAAPVVLNIGQREQLVTQTQSHVIGVSLQGELLWKIPFETQYRQNIVTAVAHDDSIIFSGFHEPLTAWRVTTAEPEMQWKNEDHAMYMSSPVISGDLLFGMSERQAGHIYCVDARDGRTLWTSPGRRGENVSVQLAGDLATSRSDALLVLLNERGTLTFARASADKYEVVAEYKLAESGTYAHPVFAGDRILIKDELHLTAYGAPK